MSASHFLCIITNEGKYHAGCNIIFRASLLNIDTADTNPFRYCAEYFDVETGQIYLRNRYYQPVTGRFTQLDPIRDGLNWYAYCYNNPIMFIDPFGTDAIVLTSLDSANGFGHTSALFQDENGDWYYTYWGDKAAAVIAIPKDYVEYETMGVNIEGSLDSLENFNNTLNMILSFYGFENITSKYDMATYVVGDFTASLHAAYDSVKTASSNSSGLLYDLKDGTMVFQAEKDIFELGPTNEEYDLITNNCLQWTISLLESGTLNTGENCGKYMSGINYGNVLIDKSTKLAPNYAAGVFVYMFKSCSIKPN